MSPNEGLGASIIVNVFHFRQVENEDLESQNTVPEFTQGSDFLFVDIFLEWMEDEAADAESEQAISEQTASDHVEGQWPEVVVEEGDIEAGVEYVEEGSGVGDGQVSDGGQVNFVEGDSREEQYDYEQMEQLEVIEGVPDHGQSHVYLEEELGQVQMHRLEGEGERGIGAGVGGEKNGEEDAEEEGEPQNAHQGYAHYMPHAPVLPHRLGALWMHQLSPLNLRLS